MPWNTEENKLSWPICDDCRSTVFIEEAAGFNEAWREGQFAGFNNKNEPIVAKHCYCSSCFVKRVQKYIGNLERAGHTIIYKIEKYGKRYTERDWPKYMEDSLHDDIVNWNTLTEQQRKKANHD